MYHRILKPIMSRVSTHRGVTIIREDSLLTVCALHQSAQMAADAAVMTTARLPNESLTEKSPGSVAIGE